MEERNLSEQSYWNKAQRGFDFDETASTTPVKREENYQLLRSEGFNEATENKYQTLSTDIVFPEEEKQLQNVAEKHSPLEFHIKVEKKTSKPTASQTVKNIILGVDYSLNHFKEKESKTELLKAAVHSHDGNAILTVLLFLKNTLKKSIFQKEIGLYIDAINTYVSYLEEDHEMDELTNIFLLMNNPDAAAMVKYTTSLQLEQPERKLKYIDNCISTHFNSGIVEDFLCASVAEHKQLLRDQLAIKDYQQAANPEEEDILKLYQILTNEQNLVDTSVMCSLVFCGLFYYNSAEAAFISPTYTRNTYKLTKKQYTWGIVRAFIITKQWSEIDALFISKNWMGSSKVKSCINLAHVIRLLVCMQAPQEIISKYVSYLEDKDEKLFLAKKYKCHSIVIEILKNNRNRIDLLQYKSSLPPHSVDFCTVVDILNNKAIKWRN